MALLEVGLDLRDGERLSSWLMTVAHRQVWRVGGRSRAMPRWSCPSNP